MVRALPEVAGASVAAVSREMLVVTPTSKQDMEQLKKALLAQPEVYELEIGDDIFRRDGAKPYDELQREMLAQAMSSTRSKVAEKVKHKLQNLFSRKKKKKRSFKEAATTGLGEDGPADAGAGRGGEVADGEGGAKRKGRKVERGKGEGIVPGSKRQAGKEGDGGSELGRRSKRRRMRERRSTRGQQGGGDGSDGSGDGDGDTEGAYGAEL
ncbi:hypothetical protein HYH03_008425 [Edaphochlamys debaryana]|uniref:Uncharacterized protein n=1 Tax=Edaphochlamys debaryana TaxID=47281 RepID=A0A835Y0Y5_9CHLO|nr:hypothetical protein HYH03_008425 [Edaphochlamys debaryana]|eukprot:KAG2493289.1 hypothetical protein HYH03_008425 [Edaphochlamys debaryana]